MYGPWTLTKGGNAGGRGSAGQGRIKGRTKWDNYYAIDYSKINKIYFTLIYFKSKETESQSIYETFPMSHGSKKL